MAMQKTYPGWGYMIENGATTLWEVWAFSDNVYSHNHPMFGSISEWFYKYLGGIRPGDNSVGFDKIIIQPYTKELEWANTSYQSILGTISSNWNRNGNHLTLKVEIPVNATAKVVIPSSFQRIKENGKPLTEHHDIRIVSRENDQSILEINSGTYVFTAEVRQD
jgi:alpha-L-rhamnosidase